MKKKQIAVKIMKHLVDHNYHGYSQVSRWGDGEGKCNIKIDGKTYKVEQGDRDCSSAVISAFEAAGISCGGATYTGNMCSCMCRTGNFKWHPMSSGYVAKSGDVYLNEACHTAMCLSAEPDMLMEFSISETGGIDGKEGDQTGWESHTCAYYNYPWDGILECINKEEIKNTSKSIATIAKEVIDGKWGNGAARKKRLKAAGYNYNAVQNKVNELMKEKGRKYHVVKGKETLSEIASRYGTTVSKLRAWNNISNPDLIYTGDRLRVK